ncbi:RagB/SusD family nutrient uptake outer membrane protein [Paraprevotella xylaniphila]|uniref:RagB/SusD family nutrient uptake outer membrane protein n=1 Tax=Paraprevotella xylaniphila TaxID=454155 RepID=UPI0023EF7B7A|nr:RagB/SusD family nutrient uptake outer membrane protein [Paraprevotella xylaniphila]
MKLKSYIFQIALAAVGAGFLGSCEDMLEPTSDYVIYENGSHLKTPADTATSLIGIIYKLQAIGDRTNLLGEVRGDLVTLTTQASADLRALANFEVTDENKYNSPRDYYAVINNCNYYLAYADTNAYDNRGNQIFAKEMAQVRSIRAWAYLQLALNYGKVPFYTNPLLTEQDANDVSLDVKDRKDIEAICDYFINDLKPYSNTEWPVLHKVGNLLMANCYFPVDMVLGDLYLWKASCQGTDAGRAYYREAAKCYFRWIMDKRNVGDGFSKPVYYPNRKLAWWSEFYSSTGTSYGLSYSLPGQSPSIYGTETFTFIPMDSAASQGYYSEVQTLYNSSTTEDGALITSTNFCITPSLHMQEISRSQSYSFLDKENRPIDVIPDEIEESPVLEGDLRLGAQWRTRTFNITTGGTANKFTMQNIYKVNQRHIGIYRECDVWLRLAEALNNGGFPRMAYAILATGISKDVVDDSVSVYCNDADLAFLNELNSANNYFNVFKTRNGRLGEEGGSVTEAFNTVGVHSRGCGYAELDPDYAYPMVDSLDKDGNRVNGYVGQSRKDWAYLNLAEEQARVDSMIINENALESCFEGKRFYDLIRFAKRYRNNAWVADPVSKREGKENRDGSLYNKLMVESNWFLNWKGQIGM